MTARLLTIHSAKDNKKNKHCKKMGHGALPADIDEVMSCVNKSYTLIYEGELQNGTFRSYSIPWVDDFKKGMVNIRWTAAVLSAVDSNSTEDYTTSSVEVNLAAGWQRSKTPKSDTAPKPYASENELRRDYLKWDTVDVREVSKNVNSLKHPIFHVHAMGRGKRVKDSKVQFAIALTVEVPSGLVDIYQKVRAKYQALLPIRMDIQTTVPANIAGNKKY